MSRRIAEIWSAKKASPSHGRIGRTELREILRSTITARASIHFAPESREQPLESIKTPVILHKHICFLCRRPYEEAEAGKCQYVDDHTWGKCPQCEDNFAVSKPIIL